MKIDKEQNMKENVNVVCGICMDEALRLYYKEKLGCNHYQLSRLYDGDYICLNCNSIFKISEK